MLAAVAVAVLPLEALAVQEAAVKAV